MTIQRIRELIREERQRGGIGAAPALKASGGLDSMLPEYSVITAPSLLPPLRRAPAQPSWADHLDSEVALVETRPAPAAPRLFQPGATTAARAVYGCAARYGINSVIRAQHDAPGGQCCWYFARGAFASMHGASVRLVAMEHAGPTVGQVVLAEDAEELTFVGSASLPDEIVAALRDMALGASLSFRPTSFRFIERPGLSALQVIESAVIEHVAAVEQPAVPGCFIALG